MRREPSRLISNDCPRTVSAAYDDTRDARANLTSPDAGTCDTASTGNISRRSPALIA
jgi:hypothetical protein